MLHIGIVGPNVNLKFQKLLMMNANVLTNINKLFLDIGTCPLHVVHNSFLQVVAALNFVVDQHALIYIFSSSYLLDKELIINPLVMLQI